MALKALNCPNCGAPYGPQKYRCGYCGSYVIMDSGNYVDLSDREFDLAPRPDNIYPGIYVFGRLLGKGEKPITLGEANYYSGKTSAGGQLLLTNQSLSFSAHAINKGRLAVKIELQTITSVSQIKSFLISQQILVETNSGEKHKFAVYHGKEWVEKIEKTRADLLKNPSPNDASTNTGVSVANDYTVELRKLKTLLDEGIITQEEFDLKKRSLLGI